MLKSCWDVALALHLQTQHLYTYIINPSVTIPVVKGVPVIDNRYLGNTEVYFMSLVWNIYLSQGMLISWISVRKKSEVGDSSSVISKVMPNASVLCHW